MDKTFKVFLLIFLILFASVASATFQKAEAEARMLSVSVFTTDSDNDLIRLLKNYITSERDYMISETTSSPLFSEFSAQRKRIGGPSIDAIKTSIEKSAQSSVKVDTVVYDMEHWSLTPTEEQNDPPAAISNAAVIAHNAGYKFGITPDRKFLLENYQKVDWQDIDLLIMQLQRAVPDVNEFTKEVNDVSSYARSANKNIEVLVQVSLTLSAPDQINNAIDRVKDIVDGIVVIYLPSAIRPGNNSNPEDLEKVLSKVTEGRLLEEGLVTVKHTISVKEGNFDFFVASNSTVNGVTFDKDRKQISLEVSGIDGTRGITDVTIPVVLLSGQFTVIMDDNGASNNVTISSFSTRQDALSNLRLSNTNSGQNQQLPMAVIVKNATATEIMISYTHSTHRISIIGTNVVPEFPFTPVMLFIGLISTIVAAFSSRKFWNNSRGY